MLHAVEYPGADCLYVGSAPGADEVTGTITVPEVAHDTEEDEYVVSKPA